MKYDVWYSSYIAVFYQTTFCNACGFYKIIIIHTYVIYVTTLKVCRNPEITLVEYAYSVTLNPLETATPSTKMSKPIPTEVINTDVCWHVDSLRN